MAADPISSTNINQTSDASEFLVNYELGPVKATGRLPLAAARQLLMSSLAPSVALVADLTLDWPEGVEARVYGEASDDAKGVYRKVGASGGGSWIRIGPLPAEDSTALAVESDARKAGDVAEGSARIIVDERTDGVGQSWLGLREKPWQVSDEVGNAALFLDEAGRVGFDQTVAVLPQPFLDPVYAFRHDDEAGNLIWGFTWDGELHAPGAVNRSLGAFLRAIGAADDVHLIEGVYDTFTRPAPTRITFGSVGGDTHAGVVAMGRQVQWVRIPPGGLTPTRQYASLSPKSTMLSGVTELWFIPQLGQSNCNGTGSTTGALTTVTPIAGRTLMFKLGLRALASSMSPASYDLDMMSDTLDELADAIEMGSAATGPETGLAQLLGRLVGAAPSTVAGLAGTLGIDSQPLINVSKGTTPYLNVLRCVAAGRWHALRTGRTFKTPVVTFVGGEAECSANMAAATFAGQLQQLWSDLNTDIKAITGQSDDIVLLIEQANSFTYNGTGIGLTRSVTAQGYVAAALANPKIVLIGANFWRTYQDGIHYNATSHRARGWLQGEILKRVLIDVAAWVPPHMASATRTGTQVDITFGGLTGSLESVTTLVSDPGNYGLVFRDAADAAVTISSASIISTDTVRLTLASDPGGPGNVIELALNGTLGNAGPTSGPRTPLRDSTAIGSDPWGVATFAYAVAGSVSCN